MMGRVDFVMEADCFLVEFGDCCGSRCASILPDHSQLQLACLLSWRRGKASRVESCDGDQVSENDNQLNKRMVKQEREEQQQATQKSKRTKKRKLKKGESAGLSKKMGV
jgi:hypothetical protein